MYIFVMDCKTNRNVFYQLCNEANLVGDELVIKSQNHFLWENK